MGDNTAISWTTHTWNPWQGCTKVSEACAHCYIYRDKARYGQDPATVIRSSRGTFRKPLAKTSRGDGTPSFWRWQDGARVFTCSWSDWFHEHADEWRDDAWEVIRQRPGLTFQILTKQPERIAANLPRDWGHGWPNVWLGVTVENQQRADERIPLLQHVPARVRFVSCEPLLGPIDLRYSAFNGANSFGSLECLHWVIAGGESGPHARPSHPDWFRDLRKQCFASNIAFLFKQWGEWGQIPGHDVVPSGMRWGILQPDGRWVESRDGRHLCTTGDPLAMARMVRLGRIAAGNKLDGIVHDAFPVVKR